MGLGTFCWSLLHTRPAYHAVYGWSRLRQGALERRTFAVLLNHELRLGVVLGSCVRSIFICIHIEVKFNLNMHNEVL